MNEEIQNAELVPVEQSRALAKPVHRTMLTADSIKFETEQRKLLSQYISANMVDGEDYGIIPGTKKKTLLKPGAEKLIQLFHCTAHYTVTNKVESYADGLFSYHFKCEIHNSSGYTIAEGVGFCSSYESKYRWRTKQRVCPHCTNETIIKGKEEYGGGWLCWEKKGGCGKKFLENDPDIINQETGSVQNPDITDVINTVYKIGKKRAMVDAALALARCSDIFTQDLDDIEPLSHNQQLQKDVQEGVARHAQQAAKKQEPQKQAEARQAPQQQAASRGEAIQQQSQPAQPSQQPKYVNYKCPKCGQVAVGRSKHPPRGRPNDEPGWHCYAVKKGCKAVFELDDPEITGQIQGGSPAPASKASDVAQTAISNWEGWVTSIQTVDQFQHGFEQAMDDMNKLSVPDKEAVWVVIKRLAADRGWFYNPTAKRFMANP